LGPVHRIGTENNYPAKFTRASKGEKIVKTVLFTLGISAVVGVLAALAVIYSGVFNVAATVVDAPLLRQVLVAAREASIERHARAIQAPALDRPQQVDDGFRIYREKCIVCHTPVGRNPSPVAKGLNPQAPGFGEDADHMSAAQLFWAAKNGIRFTGMPAWGMSLNDQELWDVVAFIMTLPAMSAADYDAIDRRIQSVSAPQE
jgi:mono/diheme cytochrome c family protein